MAGTDFAAQYTRATSAAFVQRVHSALMQDVPNMVEGTAPFTGAEAASYVAFGRALCVAARRDAIVQTVALLVAGQNNIATVDDGASLTDTLIKNNTRTIAMLVAEGGSY